MTAIATLFRTRTKQNTRTTRTDAFVSLSRSHMTPKTNEKSTRRSIAVAALTVVAGALTLGGARAQQSKQDVDVTKPWKSQFQLHGSGTTNPSKIIWYAMDRLEERSRSPIHMTYRSVGSGTGKTDWGEVVRAPASGDFASTDYGLPDTAASYLQLPFQIGAVSVFHTLPNVKSGALKISACTLAKIYTGVIKSWNDADIKADTGLTLPAQTIHVVMRSDGSSSTTGLQGYMTAACPASYSGGVTGNKFPLTGDQYHAVQGSDGVRREIAAREYSIGYLDAGHGHADDLAEFSLKNANNAWVVTLPGDPEGKTSANIPSVVTPEIITSLGTFKGDLSVVNLFNKPGAKTWPICAFTYLHVRTSYDDAETASLVKAFVKYILSEEIQAKVSAFDFFPLDTTLRDAVTNAAAGINITGATEWLFESSTSTEADTTKSMGYKTFSGKRQAYIDYAMELAQSDIADLQAASTTGAASSKNDKISLTPLTGLAAFDFILAFTALVVGSLALHNTRTSGRKNGGMSNYAVGP